MKKTSSWKNKIDPAFDTLIKTLVNHLDLMELPSDHKIIKVLKNTNRSKVVSFRTFYEDNYKAKINLFDISSIPNVNKIGKALKEIDESKNNKDNRRFYKTVISLADDLPAESKKFYYKAFNFISSDESEKEFQKNIPQKEEINYLNEFQNDVYTLLFHKYIHSLSNNDLQKEKKTLLRKLNSENILSLSFNLLNNLSLIINKKSLKGLYAEAKSGDRESLYELLKIDKTLFDHDWVRELMLEAMITGDDLFFDKVGQAIKSDPPFGKLKRGKLKYVLIFFWKMGLYRLTYPELIKLLEDSGLEVHEDPESFRKYIDREIKPLFV